MIRPYSLLAGVLVPCLLAAAPLQLNAPFSLTVELPASTPVVRAGVADNEWLELATVDGEETWEFSRQLALEVLPGTDAGALAAGLNLRWLRAVAPTLFLLEAPSPREALLAALGWGWMPRSRVAEGLADASLVHLTPPEASGLDAGRHAVIPRLHVRHDNLEGRASRAFVAGLTRALAEYFHETHCVRRRRRNGDCSRSARDRRAERGRA